MTQVARNLTDHVDGFVRDKKLLILDNDALFAKRLCSTLENTGVKIVRTAYQAYDMNAFAERWVQTVKRACLSKLILFGERHLRRTLSEFANHYHQDRPHQSLDDNPIAPTSGESPDATGWSSTSSNWPIRLRIGSAYFSDTARPVRPKCSPSCTGLHTSG